MALGPIVRAMLRNKLRFGLIAFEVALTFAIVVNCATMIRSARADLARESGLADEDLVSVVMRPFDPALRDLNQLDALVERDVEALRAMPGVRSATSSNFLPWLGGGNSTELRVVGSPAGYLRSQSYNGDEALLSTLGLELLQGKTFAPEDVRRETVQQRDLVAHQRERNPDGTAKSVYVQEVVISQAFAELAFGKEPPLGKVVEDRDGDQYRVIGVVGKFYNPYAWHMEEHVMFYTMRSHSFGFGAPYLVRAEPGRAAEVMRGIEARLLAVDPGRSIHMRSIVDVRTRYNARNTLTVGVLSLVLVLVVFVTFLGVVGLTSFSVAERTRQIGIRRALGAQRADVVGHFLLENLIVSGFGLAFGAALAYGLNVALVNRFGGSPLGSSSAVLGVLLFAAAGVVATLVPAMRAARVAPTIATRNV